MFQELKRCEVIKLNDKDGNFCAFEFSMPGKQDEKVLTEGWKELISHTSVDT
jgi:hypothetical protein